MLDRTMQEHFIFILLFLFTKQCICCEEGTWSLHHPHSTHATHTDNYSECSYWPLHHPHLTHATPTDNYSECSYWPLHNLHSTHATPTNKCPEKSEQTQSLVIVSKQHFKALY